MNSLLKILYYTTDKYFSHIIIVDFFLVVFFFLLYINIPYNYIEIPEFITVIAWLPSIFIFSNSEKINRFKRSSQFVKISISYVLYLVIFWSFTFILKNFSNIFEYIYFNIFIWIITVSFLRICIYSLGVFLLWLKSKNK